MASEDPTPTAEDIQQLRDIREQAAAALTALNRRVRKKGNPSSAEGKRIASLKRLVTWMHFALAANRTNRARIKDKDCPGILHTKDILIDGYPMVVTNITEGMQETLLMMAVDALRRSAKFNHSSLINFYFEEMALNVYSALWLDGVDQGGYAHSSVTTGLQVTWVLSGIINYYHRVLDPILILDDLSNQEAPKRSLSPIKITSDSSHVPDPLDPYVDEAAVNAQP